MADHLRAAVSRNKRRYKCDGYNLDLSYIEPTIIAMGYPAENIESIFRNQLDQVVRFLNEKHPNHYKIYNLCKERKRNNYPKNKFNGIVSGDFSFKDHAPPPFENIERFCVDVHSWLESNADNVAVVHCKAGKGRTGVMICCYLIHCGRFNTAEDVLQHYAKNRTVDEKGVTIPSQRRYVEYYARMRSASLDYRNTTACLRGVCIENLPNANTIGISLGFNVFWGNRKKNVNMKDSRTRESKHFLLLSDPIELCGDVRIEFYLTKPLLPVVKEKLFAVCFNTFFVEELSSEDYQSQDFPELQTQDSADKLCEGVSIHGVSARDAVPPSGDCTYTGSKVHHRKVLRFCKSQLDKAHKTKEFPEEACLRLFFEDLPAGSHEIGDSFMKAPGTEERSSDDQVGEETSDEDDDDEDDEEDEEDEDGGNENEGKALRPAADRIHGEEFAPQENDPSCVRM